MEHDYKLDSCLEFGPLLLCFPLKLDQINLWSSGKLSYDTQAGIECIYLIIFNCVGIFSFYLICSEILCLSCTEMLYLNFAYVMVVLVKTTKKKNESAVVVYGIIWLFEKHQSVDVAYGMIWVLICLIGPLLKFSYMVNNLSIILMSRF